MMGGNKGGQPISPEEVGARLVGGRREAWESLGMASPVFWECGKRGPVGAVREGP